MDNSDHNAQKIYVDGLKPSPCDTPVLNVVSVDLELQGDIDQQETVNCVVLCMAVLGGADRSPGPFRAETKGLEVEIWKRERLTRRRVPNSESSELDTAKYLPVDELAVWIVTNLQI